MQQCWHKHCLQFKDDNNVANRLDYKAEDQFKSSACCHPSPPVLNLYNPAHIPQGQVPDVVVAAEVGEGIAVVDIMRE